MKITQLNIVNILHMVMAVVFSTSLYAADYAIEEIVVTAQKRAESMQDVPVSVSALSSSDLEGLQLRDSGEIAAQIPNLQVNGTAGDGMPTFSLRGVSMSDYSLNQSSPVAVYVDEVYKGNRSLFGLQLYDLERAEVLRGPQGTLYGKNSTGGAINFIAKKPTFEQQEGYITVGLGNFDRKSVEGAYNAPINDQLAVRLAGTYEKADGWQDNKTAGVKDAGAIDEYAVRLSVLWEPSEELQFILRASTSESDAVNYGIVAANVGPGGIGAGIYSLYDLLGATNPADGSTYADSTRTGLDFTDVESEQDLKRKIESDSVSLTANWDVTDSLTITSISSYDDGEAWVPEDADGSANTLINSKNRVNSDQFAQDLRITSNYEGPFNFIAGVYYSKEDLTNQTTLEYSQDLDVNIDGALDFEDCQDPLLAAFGLPGVTPEGLAVDAALGGGGTGAALATLAIFGCKTANSFDQKRSSYAAYTDGSYDFNDHWTLRFGARYSRDRTKISNYVANFLGSDDVLVFPTIDIARDSITDKEFTSRVGIDYTTDGGNLFYASYSHGYRSGAFNAQAFQDPSEVTSVKPETLDAFEIGFKSTLFDKRLQLNGAAFYYRYDDQQFLDIDPQLIQTLINIEESEIKGLELELVARPAESLLVRAGLGLIDAEVTKGVLSGVNLKGNQLVQAPDVNFNVAADWDLFSNETGMLTLHVDSNYIDSQYFDVFNTDRTQQNSYWVSNARLTFTPPDSAWSVNVWAKNLADEEYITSAIDLQAFFTYDYTHVGAVRTFGADVSFRF
jgi:iron complex outermembrane recepter protein